MASCPTCQKEIDSLRAPSARIVGGKVLTYCSAACASGAAEAGAAAARARIAAEQELDRDREREVLTRVAAQSALAVLKQTGRIVREDDPAEPRGRSLRSTNPIEPGDVLEEVTIPKRARTEPPAPPPGRRQRRGLVLMFAGAIIVGGMAIAIVQAVSPSSPSPAEAGGVPDSRKAELPVPPPPDHAVLADQAARAALAALVAGDSQRVRRIAAAALARTGDAAAIAALGELLTVETSDITRLDVAYALARAGDVRGTGTLAAGLKSGRKDVRADAARLLVLLGDPDGAGAKELGRSLDNRSQRLGAAEALARIANPDALEVLDAIHLDATASSDDRIRAAIALGRARRADVTGELHGLLSDGRFNAFAAMALAELGDPRGRDVLVRQLDVASLRVGAALALRRLDPALDPVPFLPALSAALAAGKDVARVTAAEAILILTGPSTIADRD